ncbi:MAG: hypothetical protein KDC12_03135 [Flavobacteriales bacterium]|nr:hypothetical protein [Flavobacteriales bacterium]
MKRILFVLLAITALTSCLKKEPEDQKGTIRIDMVARVEGEPFELGEIYTNVLTDRYWTEIFKAYVSNIRAHRMDGSSELLAQVFLANFDGGNTVYAEVDPGTFSGLSFGIGVPEELNKGNDPSQYPNDHPLSAIGSEGMFWTWNSGYIFTMFQGKADTLDGQDVTPLHPFAYHCGEDFLYIDKSYDTEFTLEACKTKTFTIVFDVDRFWYSQSDTLDVAKDYLTHTSGNVELAERCTAFIEEAVHLEE